jgi:hypothetical protein
VYAAFPHRYNIFMRGVRYGYEQQSKQLLTTIYTHRGDVYAAFPHR